MHCIQNTTSRKDIFSVFNLKAIINRIAKSTEPEFSTSLNIREVPTFYAVESTLPKIPQSLKETLVRMCAIAATKLTTAQKDIIEKANQYGLSYQLEISESDRWNHFVDIIYSWEDLLEEAKGYKINWDSSKHDPLILRSLIEEQQEKEYIEAIEIRKEEDSQIYKIKSP
jgi:hypothetical protein